MFSRGVNRRTATELVIVAAIFIAGYTVGGRYRETFAASGGREDYAQVEFGAAVALACGQGFIHPGAAPTPAVVDFLERQRDGITCADLPPNLPRRLPNFTQGLYRYLMTAVALRWMLSGVISWSGLTPVFGTAYGLTLVAAYGLFRVGIGRVLSIAATGALLISAVHLGYLPYLREYAKAPFILTLMLMMARLALKPLTVRRAVTFGVAFGVVLGIGFGFRNDLLINIVPWVAVVLLCLPGHVLANLKLKALCLVLSGAMFVFTAWPILSAYSRGSNSGHVALLGLMSAIDPRLGVSSSLYDWGYHYDDGMAYRLITSFGYRQYDQWVGYLTPDYDRTAAVYITAIVRNWPADMVTRAYASTLRMIDELPFGVGAYAAAPPSGIHNHTVIRVYGAQKRVLRALSGTGVWITALALLVIAARRPRAAFTLLAFLVYFGGYPAIQFHVRHFFHLEFIAWWGLAFLIECAALGLYRDGRRRWRGAPAVVSEIRIGQRAARVCAFAAGGTLLVVAPLLVLRGYQAARVRALLESSYLGAEREPLATARTAGSEDRVRVDMPTLWSDRNPEEHMSTEYVVAEFSARRCRVPRVKATFLYEGAPGVDLSRDLDVRVVPGDRSTFVFFAAFYDDTTRFKAIELVTADADCLVSVSRVKKGHVPPVLLNAVVTPNWRRADLYQTITRWESSSDGEEALPRVYAARPSISLGGLGQLRPFPPGPPALEYRDKIVAAGGQSTLVIRGRVDRPGAHLLLLRDRPLPAGARVMAAGEMRTGGLTFGILKGSTWAGYINVVLPGRFVVTVAVPETAVYTVVLSDYRTADWLDNNLPERLVRALRGVPMFAYRQDAEVDTVGWLPPDVGMH